jgi:hypothetical protein
MMNVVTVSPDMLFGRLFIAENLFGNPDWYLKWFSTFDISGPGYQPMD